VNLSFDDSLKGVQVQVPVELETACSECHGSGARPGTSPRICPECNGRGVVSESQGLFALSQPCPRCRGNGTVIEDPCPKCHGSGRERRTKRYTVKIPRRREGRHAHPPEGQGRGRLRRRRGGRPLRRHARRRVTDLRAARQRPARDRAAVVRRRRARRDGRRADARRRGVAQGSRGLGGRQAAPHPRPRRTEALGAAARATCSLA
jgi:hypothetical protein